MMFNRIKKNHEVVHASEYNNDACYLAQLSLIFFTISQPAGSCQRLNSFTNW